MLKSLLVYRLVMADFQTLGTISVGKPSTKLQHTFIEGQKISIALDVTNTFLRDADIYKKDNGCSYVELLNAHLKVVKLISTERLEDRLKRACWNSCDKYRKLKGKKQRDFACKTVNISILENELVDVTTLETPELNTPSRRTKSVDVMSKSHRYRTLGFVKDDIVKSLSFLDTLGLNIQSVNLSTESGKRLSLSFNDADQECDLTKTVAFILDKFGVSDEAYHEMTQLVSELPRKHSISALRQEQTSQFEIHKVPGVIPGAIISFRGELIKRVTAYIEEKPDVSKVVVMLGGDGTKVSRISNFVVFSFHLVDKDRKLASSQQCTLAIIKCNEDYFSLKETLQGLFSEVNDIWREKCVVIKGRSIDIELIFGSDMKMIQIMLGLGGSTGNYACPWCIIHKKDRHDTTHDWLHYNDTKARSVTQLKEHANKLQFGVQHEPLLDIDCTNYVVDELHLMMRITDVLERNLIDEAKERDKLLERDGSSPRHVSELVECFRECGVSFAVWEDRDSKTTKWTSLSGMEKKKVLRKLPDTLVGKLSPDTESSVIRLWSEFRDIYGTITHSLHQTGQDVFKTTKIESWVDLFVSLGGSRRGYKTVNVTPYMHCLVYHVPAMVEKFGSLRLLSGQALEKLNDDIKHIHQKKTQKWDPTSEALGVRKRLEESNDNSRTKRAYTKRKVEYWDNSIIEMRREKRLSTNVPPATEKENDGDLSESQLRDKLLNKHGIRTKSTNRNTLVAMLNKVSL